jgi:hypothetical protein
MDTNSSSSSNNNNNNNNDNDNDGKNTSLLLKGGLMAKPPSTAIKATPPQQSDSKLSLLLDDEDQCSICLERFSDDNPKVAASRLCSHEFHLQCKMSWSERSETCPICSSKLDLD